MLYYIYDDSANILGFKYNGLQYYYQKNYQNDIIGIYDSDYNLVVTYKYDAWGKVISVNDTTEDNIGAINPYRYRSYYYDEETKLYYLNSRYYNPEWCRFINADGYVSTGQGICDSNLYLYCSNNSINVLDFNGNLWGAICSAAKTIALGAAKMISSLAPAYAGCAGVAAADGPLPFGDIVGVIGAAAITVGAIGTSVYAYTKIKSKTLATDKKKQEKSTTKIYRYGGTNPGNLTPKQKDLNSSAGLSFSTRAPLGREAAVTTLEAINSTGIVFAIKDGENHVSVYPVGGSMKDWVEAGTSSKWTQAVKSVVVKWDGVN